MFQASNFMKIFYAAFMKICLNSILNSDGKKSAYNVGDLGSILGSRG